jgi:peptide/nickel transport system permease protein
MARPLRSLLHGLLLILGVTFISFLLMVWFGPDQTFTLIGKNATAERIAEVRHELGYDQPFLKRYADFLVELATLDLGLSNSSGERVSRMLARSVPVTLALMLPGFLLGNLLGIAFGLQAAQRRGQWSDRVISSLSVTGMSLSFLIIIIALQVLLSVTLGYNTRFYRAVFVDEFGKDHIRTARAFGASPAVIMWKHVLKNSMVPIITRVLFSIPLVVISGSLLIESYFGIPGIGKITFEAITNGDQPVLKAVVALTAVAFVLIQVTADLLYRLVDPRVA